MHPPPRTHTRGSAGERRRASRGAAAVGHARYEVAGSTAAQREVEECERYEEHQRRAVQVAHEP